MVSARDKATIAALARRYGAAKVWLFGSNAEPRRRGRDLDLAVEGVAPARFFQFVGDLMLSLSQPLDVVALDRPSKLGSLIRIRPAVSPTGWRSSRTRGLPCVNRRALPGHVAAAASSPGPIQERQCGAGG